MSYSSELSRLRAAKLQQLCAKRNLNCLVFILGLDSKRNKLDEQAFFWLFKGVTGLSRLRTSSVSLDFEELAWIVTPGSVEVYVGSACNNLKDTEAIGREVEFISASWLGVQVYKLTKEEVSDSDLGQESKILWFVRRLSRLLGPVGMCAEQVDRWPLVQAYALDFFSLSFFTRSHSVTDISQDLLALFSELDEASLYALAREQVPRFERSFTQTAEFLNQQKTPAQRGFLEAQAVQETLAFAYDYARIQATEAAVNAPSVRFGAGVPSLKDCSVLALQGVCGESGLLCCRTWFVTPHNQAQVFWSDPDFKSVVAAYLAMEKAVSAAIEKAARLNGQDLKQQVLLELFKTDWDGVTYLKEVMRYNSRVDLQSLDADGTLTEYDPSKLLLHSLRLTVSDVCKSSGEVLGALEFADSFVIVNGLSVKLTGRVRIFDLWDARVEEVPGSTGAIDQFSAVLNVEGLEVEGTVYVYGDSWVHSSLKLGTVVCRLNEFPRTAQTPDGWLEFSNEHSKLLLQTSSDQFLRLKAQFNFESELIPQPFTPVNISPLVKLKPSRKALEPKGSTAVYVVTGVLGSGKNSLGEQLAKYSGADLLKPTLRHCAYFDETYWREALQEVTRDKVVAVLPDFCTASVIMPYLRSDMFLAAVLVKVLDKRVFSGKRKDYLPGFVAHVGAADICVLEETRQSSLQAFIKAVNPEVTILSARGPVSLDQARHIFSHSCSGVLQAPVTTLEIYESLFLQCELPLRYVKLENRLRTLESLDEGPLSLRLKYETEMELIAVKGDLVLLPGESVSLSKATACHVKGGIHGITVRPSQSSELGLVFVGRKLNRDKLISVLLDSRAFADKIPVKTLDGLSDEEVRHLESNLPPPEDFLFDGTYYIDSDGSRYMRHPYLELELAHYIEEENELIGEYNRKLQKESTLLNRQNADARVLPVKV